MRLPTLCAALLLFAAPALTTAAPAPEAQERPRKVILFIADGFGPASVTMARDFTDRPLHLDGILVGTARTYATGARTTDSAAGATAYSAGIKTRNGRIAVDAEDRPVGTILEAAEDAGLATGLVATSRITHATPASFSAHVPDRGMEAEIAAQQISRGIDVFFGGGRDYFLPQARGGRRADGRDLIEEARRLGYALADSPDDLRGDLSTPVLGLFAGDNLAYEIDRDAGREPSLAEMTRAAIELLNRDPDGFFLMIEASRIDHAAHDNDPAAHVRDVAAYDEAVAAALDFARRDGQTLVVSTADHETGGLTLGRSGSKGWTPEVLRRVRRSSGLMADRIRDGAEPETVLREDAGVTDLTPEERRALADAAARNERLPQTINDVVSRRAGVGWTTSGHTAVDVNLYAFGPGADRFRGHHENTEVGLLLQQQLDLDVAPVTQRLRK